jgi:rod shape-determining protein MreD
LGVIVLVAALVQIVVLDHAKISGVSPHLVLAVAALAGMVGGPERGALTGFLAGLLVDLATTAPLALTALTGTLVGYAAGNLLAGVVRRSRALPVLVAGIAGLAGTLLYVALAALIGRTSADLRQILLQAVLVGALNALLAPPVVALLQPADVRRRILR